MKLLYIISFILLTSCSVFDNEHVIEDELQGEWNWVQSTGGFIGETIHVDSVDYEMTLIIYHGGSAFWYRELLQEYKIKEGEEDWAEGNLVMYPVENETEDFKISRIIDGVYGGELRLLDNCADCYSYTFTR
ncbi:MAG: hypothetical protein WD059_04350 [Balneolaceae bacterium]